MLLSELFKKSILLKIQQGSTLGFYQILDFDQNLKKNKVYYYLMLCKKNVVGGAFFQFPAEASREKSPTPWGFLRTILVLPCWILRKIDFLNNSDKNKIYLGNSFKNLTVFPPKLWPRFTPTTRRFFNFTGGISHCFRD